MGTVARGSEYSNVERGVALVRKVVQRLKADEELDPPEPVPAEVLARLTFPNGKPLPPSLREFLAFDARWLGLFDDPEQPEFDPMSIAELVDEEFGFDDLADQIDGELGDVLTGDCYLLPGDGDARYFLYVGESDSMGEYPVFYVDTDDAPTVGVHAPGLDVYLAECFDVIPPPSTYGEYAQYPVFAASMQQHATANFAGHGHYEIGSDDFEALEDDDLDDESEDEDDDADES